MSVATQIFSALSGDAALTAVVADRIYWPVLPYGIVHPAVVFRRSNTAYTQTVHGPIIASDATFDIYCVAKSADKADDIGDIVEAITSGLRFLNRIEDFDEETENFVSILTVGVWKT